MELATLFKGVGSRIYYSLQAALNTQYKSSGLLLTEGLTAFQIKRSLTRDFRLQVIFMNQCPPGPQVFHWSLFEFFRKFAEIFTNYTV